MEYDLNLLNHYRYKGLSQNCCRDRQDHKRVSPYLVEIPDANRDTWYISLMLITQQVKANARILSDRRWRLAGAHGTEKAGNAFNCIACHFAQGVAALSRCATKSLVREHASGVQGGVGEGPIVTQKQRDIWFPRFFWRSQATGWEGRRRVHGRRRVAFLAPLICSCPEAVL